MGITLNIVLSRIPNLYPVPTLFFGAHLLPHHIPRNPTANRPFAQSGHMAQNKLHWDPNYAVRLSKQRKVGLDWYEFLCFGIASQGHIHIENLP